VEYCLADNRPLPPRAQMAREYWYEVPEDRTGILVDSLLDLAQEIYPPESEALIPWFNLKAESLINRKKIAASETYMWQIEYNGAARLLDRALWIINNYKVADTHPAVLRLRLNKAYCNYLKGDFSGPLHNLEPLEPYFVNLPLSENATKAMYHELLARCSLKISQRSRGYSHCAVLGADNEEYHQYLCSIDSTAEISTIIKRLDTSSVEYRHALGEKAIEARNTFELLSAVRWRAGDRLGFLAALENMLYIDYLNCHVNLGCDYILDSMVSLLLGNISAETVENRIAIIGAILERNDNFTKRSFLSVLREHYKELLVSLEKYK